MWSNTHTQHHVYYSSISCETRHLQDLYPFNLSETIQNGELHVFVGQNVPQACVLDTKLESCPGPYSAKHKISTYPYTCVAPISPNIFRVVHAKSVSGLTLSIKYASAMFYP